MPRPADLNVVRHRSFREVEEAAERHDRLIPGVPTVPTRDDTRWLACMTLVDMYSAWERFAERRLVAALNHYPDNFLTKNQVRGVTRIPVGLADYVVRGGRSYFNFTACSDLIEHADKLVTRGHNPFRAISTQFRQHIDVASALRNHILHGSDFSSDRLARQLRTNFGFKTMPKPGDFLDAVDRRGTSPLRGRRRIVVFAYVLGYVIDNI